MWFGIYYIEINERFFKNLQFSVKTNKIKISTSFIVFNNGIDTFEKSVYELICFKFLLCITLGFHVNVSG